MKVKICGLNPLRDIKLCVDLGVHFLGFVFFDKSPRNVKLSDIKTISNYNRKNSSSFKHIIGYWTLSKWNLTSSSNCIKY